MSRLGPERSRRRDRLRHSRRIDLRRCDRLSVADEVADGTAGQARPDREASSRTYALNPGDQRLRRSSFAIARPRVTATSCKRARTAATDGYFKFEQPNGLMTCLFKDDTGLQRAVQSPVATKDGEWHVIRCELSDWGIRLYVDGTLVRSRQTSMGTIANTKVLSIGGKYYCDQIDVTCDYFSGDIDYVKIEKGGSTPPPPPPTSVDCTVSWSGSTATLTWNATDGRDIVRRNGSWLATPPSGAGTYVDQNAPSGASYLIRTWTSAGSADHPCTGSDPPPPPPPPPPTSVDCTVSWSGSTATLTWNATDGRDIVRRNGSWLATPPSGAGTYVDQNAPSGASYLIRTWTSAGSADHPCTGSDPPPPPPPPGSGCTFVVDGSTTTLTWDPLGGTDVVRRDGRWLATVGPNVGTYADANSPEGADYLIRAWTGAGSVDTECVAAPT